MQLQVHYAATTLRILKSLLPPVDPADHDDEVRVS
jgi:hypothetical protein